MRPCIRKTVAWLTLAFLLPSISYAQDAPMSSGASTNNMGAMQNMDMNDNGSNGMLLIDQWEYAHGNNGNGPMWQAQAWYGNDGDKVWLRTEGEGNYGRIDDGDVEALWNRTFSAFWSTQLGVRHDVGAGPQRNWAALGVQGMAPYWIDVEATAYASDAGRLAARVRAEYTVQFTQRLVLQPEFEINLYDKDDPARYIGSDDADAQLGLRLRYDITRQFAPYLGLVWTRHFGANVNVVDEQRMPGFDRQIVAGIRIWL